MTEKLILVWIPFTQKFCWRKEEGELQNNETYIRILYILTNPLVNRPLFNSFPLTKSLEQANVVAKMWPNETDTIWTPRDMKYYVTAADTSVISTLITNLNQAWSQGKLTFYLG